MAINFDWKNDELLQRIEHLDTKVFAAVQMYAVTKAPVITSSMQINRPWTDRTNLAKTRLTTSVSAVDNSLVRLTLSHGVWYGVYLEVAHERKYAIIKPTLDQQGPIIMADMNNLFSKVRV